tara:strand:- start:319 stop:498 length:180 start_codon:yes stop_codon:yes gene_type:complete
MDLLSFTLILLCVYVVSSMILKGGLMIMYGYFMYKMFSGDRDFDMSDSEPDLDYDEVPF